ncbi:MAG: hypothetical protein JOY60_17465 [Burkholderiaceae bacterium]|nr:hypothetical protein [Burkholderiaceae bacterium]
MKESGPNNHQDVASESKDSQPEDVDGSRNQLNLMGATKGIQAAFRSTS